MILQLVDDMRRALDAECYFAALAIALMLPDICGKAEYPAEGVGKRYVKWYDEYIEKYERCPKKSEEEPVTPHLTGEIIYKLRNCFLHQGTPCIEKEEIKLEENKIDHFVLVIESKNEFDIYGDSASLHFIMNKKVVSRSYEMSVRCLCLTIGSVAKSYYEDNLEKFDFLEYTIDDRRT